MDGLCMALHCIWTTNSFQEAIVKCANIRGDSDSVCAVLGQMAGMKNKSRVVVTCRCLVWYCRYSKKMDRYDSTMGPRKQYHTPSIQII